jgi:hypothetical protein
MLNATFYAKVVLSMCCGKKNPGFGILWAYKSAWHVAHVLEKKHIFSIIFAK